LKKLILFLLIIAFPVSVHPDTVKIASWNIQVFGKSKAAKPEVMKVIVDTVALYDIVAIQEIREKGRTALTALERGLDAKGEDWICTAGPRLGRTSSKEQYAFCYRAARVDEYASYTVQDPDDLWHREPMVAHFRVGDFTFKLLNIHVDPGEATHEVNSLHKLISGLQEKFPDEDDFIILGDLNADCSYYDEDNPDYDIHGPEYVWMIHNYQDTNLAESDCTYDRIIGTQGVVQDWTGTAGVLRFDILWGLDPKAAKKVSDHYPVYAEFYTGQEGEDK